jgi:outer membrane protein assembly factor BamD
VAAINRAQNAITDYKDVPALEEALFILLRSYEALGMNQLAGDTRRVMEKTYPKSEYLARGFKKSDDPWWKFW